MDPHWVDKHSGEMMMELRSFDHTAAFAQVGVGHVGSDGDWEMAGVFR